MVYLSLIHQRGALYDGVAYFLQAIIFMVLIVWKP